VTRLKFLPWYSSTVPSRLPDQDRRFSPLVNSEQLELPDICSPSLPLRLPLALTHFQLKAHRSNFFLQPKTHISTTMSRHTTLRLHRMYPPRRALFNIAAAKARTATWEPALHLPSPPREPQPQEDDGEIEEHIPWMTNTRHSILE
jgi:hypothetical protein